jgi:hypothetical protein
MTVGALDVMWFAEPGIVYGEGTFAFRVFTWVDSRASYLAQESMAMIQRGYLLRGL